MAKFNLLSFLGLFLVTTIILGMTKALPRPRTSIGIPRVVGGTNAEFGEFLYQLSLEYSGSHICGASIVRSDYAITAAHCATYALERYTVLAGCTDRSNLTGNEQRVNVAKIILHEHYKESGLDYDIAILILASPINISPDIQTGLVKIPPAETDFTDEMGIATGWGTLSSGGSYLPPHLQKVDLPIMSEAQCIECYGKHITDRMLCAGYMEGAKDTCQGDSGGPLVVNETLVGIVSFGAGCAQPKYPGVYTKVSAFTDWISSHVSQL